MSAAKRLSPAASLLRHSRLMAMPAAVPPPPSYFLTNPDVSPHPVVQAIATPPSSHARGNWGLKRDLPTKTKYPFLRYTALDTLEHFTTYESAADDVLTLKKWQEMDLPLLKGPAIVHTLESHSYSRREPVFDGGSTTDDNLLKAAEPGRAAEKATEKAAEKAVETYKWRFKGPYLPDLPAGEFSHYIETKIKPRREEFIAYVTRYQHRWGGKSSFQERSDVRNSSDEQWSDEPTDDTDLLDPIDVRALRADPDLLEKLAVRFLDLPLYSRPHRTHPSGGLHYTRSSAHVGNDPLDGPRAGPKQVLGRNMNHQSSTGALVGVGGIVAKATDAGRLDDSVRLYNNRYHVKKYVPGKARLDALGRVLLDVDIISDGSQGAYSGLRRLGYTNMGLAGSGEEATDMLKTMGGSGRGRYAGVYDSMSDLPKTGEGRPGRAGPTVEKQQHMDDVMDLLASHRFNI